MRLTVRITGLLAVAFFSYFNWISSSIAEKNISILFIGYENPISRIVFGLSVLMYVAFALLLLSVFLTTTSLIFKEDFGQDILAYCGEILTVMF